MAVSAGISNALERNWGMVDRAIDGLSDETLARRISDSDNSIGWLLFHMSRVADVFMNARFQGKPQIWIEDGWCEKRLVREIRPERRSGDDRPRLGHGAPGRVAASLQRRPVRVLRGHEGLLPGLYVLRDRRGVERHHEPEARFGSRAERGHHGCPGL